MNKKIINCIVCPLGCTIEISIEQDKIAAITGNRCKRGIDYASSEHTNPVRTLTTSVRTFSLKSPLLPVRSNKALPKDKLMLCMEIINKIKISTPVRIGDIIISNILNTGVDIIATKNII